MQRKTQPEDALEKYRGKRDFRRTSEPAGSAAARFRRRDLRFVVQRHQARRLHYDFRLELDGVLKSWAVPKGPSLDPDVKRLAVQVEDHPLAYGDFEGEIAPGNYGAGQVRIWDAGTWTPQGDAHAGLTGGHLHFRLDGGHLHGDWILVRTGRNGQWLLRKLEDGYAVDGDDAEAHPPLNPAKSTPQNGARHADRRASRVTGTGAEPAPAKAPKHAMPAFVEPQLATLVERAPADAGWSYELKYDGYRMMCRMDANGVRLYSRTGHDWTDRMRKLAAQLAKARLGRGWLDGEVVVFNADGHSDFQALQQELDGNGTGLHLVAFDLPYWDGRDLRDLPLAQRQEHLAALVQRAKAGLPLSLTDRLVLPDPADGSAAVEQACHLGLEGLIAKRLDAAYTAGRSRTWLKLKCRPRQEFVVGGYTRPNGARSGFGALLVGVREDSGLRYAGRVGTGYKRDDIDTLLARMRPLHQAANPFDDAPPQVHRWRRTEGDVQWLRPELVIEAGFSGWTQDGVLRQASFAGLRQDKPARDVTRETAIRSPAGRAANMSTASGDTIAGVRISHPDRIVYPDDGIRKHEVAEYYAAIAPHLMPHLRNRRLALMRCPGGLAEPCFFQKHIDDALPDGLKRDGEHILIVNTRGLVGLAQRGVIELHTWGSSLPRPDAPDRLTLDLDPGPGVSWKMLYEAAHLARTLMQALGMVPFVKTTGGKGLHIVAPIRRTLDWPTARAFARAMASHLAQQMPDRFTDNMNKARRSGRIFIDYLRNGDNATAIAAFSLRARTGAPVSVPLAWDELDVRTDLRGDVYNLRNIGDRLARQADPWRDYGKSASTVTRGVLEQMDVKPEQPAATRRVHRKSSPPR